MRLKKIATLVSCIMIAVLGGALTACKPDDESSSNSINPDAYSSGVTVGGEDVGGESLGVTIENAQDIHGQKNKES